MSSFKHAFILQIIVSRFNSSKQIKITQTHTHTAKVFHYFSDPPKKSHHYYNYQKFMTTMTTATKF